MCKPQCISNPRPAGCRGTPVPGLRFCRYCWNLILDQPTSRADDRRRDAVIAQRKLEGADL